MNKNPHELYQTNSITTATPGELTFMLYNGCIKFIRLAKISIEQNNVQDKNVNIQKAQKIVQEFMVTLNMDYAVSKDMMSLYDYMYRRLIEANVKNDVAILDEVEGLVIEFRDTWKQVMTANKG